MSPYKTKQEELDALLIRIIERGDPHDRKNMRRLVAEGANINVRDSQGMTPLHRAVIFEYNKPGERLVGLITRAGADVNARDDGGETPLHYLCETRELVHSCDEGTVKSAMILLAAGADVNACDDGGVTPLHCLCALTLNYGFSTSALDLADALIKAGADVNACDKQGNNAIHHACDKQGNPSSIHQKELVDRLITILIEAGIDLSHRNEAGVLPQYSQCIEAENAQQIHHDKRL